MISEMALRTATRLSLHTDQLPTPNSSATPPFAAKFEILMFWVKWGATGVCMIAFMILGGAMAMSIRRGESSEHITKLGTAAAGVVVVGLAAQIVGALL